MITDLTRTRLATIAFILILTQALSETASATSVIQMTFAEICDRAELIVEGKVLSSESWAEADTGRIATMVRIAVTDRLKGPRVAPRLTLRFAGGSVGALSLSVADMRMPEVGETGIYFVESLSVRQVHPLVGWSQGHFVEYQDPRAGRSGLFTPDGRRVLGIGPDAPLMRQRPVLPGTGSIMEAEIENSASGTQAAMPPRDFKDRVRARIAASDSDR